MKENRKKNYTIGFILATLAGVFWGITGPLGQYLFEQTNVVPEWLVPYRLICAGILIIVLLYIKEGKEIFAVWKNRQDAKLLCMYGILGMMPVQYSFFVAVEASNGGTATVLQYTSPVMMILYYMIFQKERPKKINLLAVAMVVVGIFCLSTNGSLHSLVITPKGLVTGLLCAFFTCLYSMLPQKLLCKYDSSLICGWAMVIGGILLGLWKHPWTLGVEMSGKVGILFILLVIVGTILPFCFSLTAIPVIGPVYANVLSSIEPVVASLLTFLLLGTSFGVVELFGFACIIATIILLALFGE